MESRNYEKILNAMPKTGVYVIREEDWSLLYFNQQAQNVSQGARLGASCHEVWTGSCASCPLRTIGDRQESRAVGYNARYGGVVDITATRMLWNDSTPAFVLTVIPRMDGGYTYRKILRLDLRQDSCVTLKQDPEEPIREDLSFSQYAETLAASGTIHPDDVERFRSFLRQLPSTVQVGASGSSLLYRRLFSGVLRWNLMEVIPDPDGEGRFVTLCIKDVHIALREGQEREEQRSQELIRSLGEENFHIYTINLSTGSVDIVRLDGQMMKDSIAQSWDSLLHLHILNRLHEAYRDDFQNRFSMEGLRQVRAQGQTKIEMICQWYSGETCRYISVTAYFNQERADGNYTVLAIRDVDQQMRREFARTRRDMQMAAILKSRYRMMTTVFLETGQCERVDLSLAVEPENTLTGDYMIYIKHALANYVLPEDADVFRNTLSLEHLRERAAATEDYAEETCLYRQPGTPIRWIDLRVIYTRQKDRVMVNILGQDVTRERHQEESRLHDLEDRAYVISSLSTLFFSTYYINLEQDTFRPVTQLRRVEEVLGEEVNYTSALQIYADHFIHPDDRAEYLRVMNFVNLRENLRWWQPYMAVEYRRLPKDPSNDACEWIRATAVLARTGTDDMPMTAVYVAQNITGSKRPQPGETL